MKALTPFVICFFMMHDASAETRLVFLPGLLYFNYEETTDNNIFLDGETGVMSGYSAQIEYKNKDRVGGILHGGIYTGTVTYDGHAAPSGVPVQSKTETNLFNLGAILLLPLDGAGINMNFSVGYQFKRWEREITPTISPSIGTVSGLYELYEWEEISMGVETHLAERFSQQWSFYAGVFQTRDPRIEINLTAYGDGSPELQLGSATGADFSAQWLRKNRTEWYSGYKVSWKAWRFGKSNSRNISGSRVITEPKSMSSTVMFEVVIASGD